MKSSNSVLETNHLNPDAIIFGSVKEDRDWYFVEYCPPIDGYRFSTLSVVLIDSREIQDVASAMEAEALVWINRYPVPVMLTAFSPDESVFHLASARADNHLIAWKEPNESTPILHWRMVSDSELPDTALDREKLRGIFIDVPSRLGRDVHSAIARDVSARRLGWWIVFVWAVVVPIIVAVLESYSEWLGMVVLLYALIQAGGKAFRMLGWMSKSQRQIAKEKEELRMRHHHYHCKLNPQGFEKLVAENFRRQATNRTLEEAQSLRSQSGAVE